MIVSKNPPLAVPAPSAPEDAVTEYAYYREMEDGRRPAKALGSWRDVWDRSSEGEGT